jgi:hypothetical protein
MSRFSYCLLLGSAQVELGTCKLRELKLPAIDLSPIGKFAPKLHYEVKPQDVRSFGDLLWYSYVFWIDTPRSTAPGIGCTCAERMPRPAAHPQHAQFRKRSGVGS